jgi:hypothetical protein
MQNWIKALVQKEFLFFFFCRGDSTAPFFILSPLEVTRRGLKDHYLQLKICLSGRVNK